jgi:hypothetical protein
MEFRGVKINHKEGNFLINVFQLGLQSLVLFLKLLDIIHLSKFFSWLVTDYPITLTLCPRKSSVFFNIYPHFLKNPAPGPCWHIFIVFYTPLRKLKSFLNHHQSTTYLTLFTKPKPLSFSQKSNKTTCFPPATLYLLTIAKAYSRG